MLNLNHRGVTNIASGVGTSTKQIINIAEKSYKKKLKLINKDVSEVKECIGSNKLICNKLNYQEFIKLDDHICRINNK